MKALYHRLTQAGKPPRAALTAIMQKLIILANTLIKTTGYGKKKSLEQYGYSSVVDLKFLSSWQRARAGTSNPKTTLETLTC